MKLKAVVSGICALALAASLGGCAKDGAADNADEANGKLKIVATTGYLSLIHI